MGVVSYNSMSIHQGRSKRKPSGGRNTASEPKRIHRLGNSPAQTVIDDEKTVSRRIRGGDEKQVALQADTINLHVPADDDHVQADLHEVVESPSNQNYVRRNIITKGCIVKTSEGRARVTNRPGQDGVAQGVVVDE